ncbi:unnamed protein product [Lactuca saligna]|uniref:Uncharacterized protein n=1 Tax=Lactuca saligna TaxID=75948 RepID=A0AA35Z3R2_LACSI|nr:unnamed protein product [Lactuca saligna]
MGNGKPDDGSDFDVFLRTQHKRIFKGCLGVLPRRCSDDQSRSGRLTDMWRAATDNLCGCQSEITILQQFHHENDLIVEEWESFQFRFGFVAEYGVQIPLSDASLYSPPEGKFGIPIALFKAGICLPTTNFFNLIIREYGFSVREMTLISMNKIVGFELLCRALGRLPTILAFKYFFNASTQLETRTLSRRPGVLTLVHDKKSKKNWHEKFLWVNYNLVVLSYPRTKMYVDRAPTLFGTDKELVDALEKISINGKDWHDNFLAAEVMSAAWRAQGKIPEIFVEKEGVEEFISLEKAFQGLFDGKL